MQVKLRRDLFLDGTLYRCDPYPTQIPSEYRDRLPADAEVLIGVVKAEPVVQPSLRDLDIDRASSEAFEKRARK